MSDRLFDVIFYPFSYAPLSNGSAACKQHITFKMHFWIESFKNDFSTELEFVKYLDSPATHNCYRQKTCDCPVLILHRMFAFQICTCYVNNGFLKFRILIEKSSRLQKSSVTVFIFHCADVYEMCGMCKHCYCRLVELVDGAVGCVY